MDDGKPVEVPLTIVSEEPKKKNYVKLRATDGTRLCVWISDFDSYKIAFAQIPHDSFYMVDLTMDSLFSHDAHVLGRNTIATFSVGRPSIKVSF